MKNLFLKNLAISILGGLLLIIIGIMHAKAQQLEFIYAAPTATMDANFNNARAFTRVWNGTVIPVMNGYRYVYVDPANVGKFRSVAPAMIKKTYDSINQPASALRKKLDRVMKLSSNRVTKITFFLIDDNTGLPANTDSIFCQSPKGALTIAWP